MIGLAGEYSTTNKMESLGFEPIGNTQIRKSDGDFDNAVGEYQGRQGIDGIYRKEVGRDSNNDPIYDYAIVETKATGSGEAGGLADTNDGQQMSRQWIEARLRDSGLDDADINSISTNLGSPNSKITFI